MQNINRPTTDPMGGNKRLYYIADVDLNGVNRETANTVSIDYVSGKKFYYIDCVHETANVVESGVRNDLGTLYDITVDAIVAGNINDTNEVFDEMLGYRFVIAREDQGCNITILGNTEQALDFKIISTSKNEAAQRKETKLQFYGRCYAHEKTLSGTLQVNS